MAVTPRGEGYQARFAIKDRGRYSASFSSKQEALTWEAEQKRRLREGLSVLYPGKENPEEKPQGGRKKAYSTLGDLVTLVNTTRWRHLKAGWERKLRADQVVKFFGAERPIGEVFDPIGRQKMIDAMQLKGLTNSTINRHLSVISTLKNEALEMDIIPKAPKIKLLPQKAQRKLRVSLEQEASYLEACRRLGLHDFADLVCVWRDTGARLNEPVKTQWVDWSKSAVTLMETKNDDPRTIPLTERVKEIIARRRMTHGKLEGPFAGISKRRVRSWYEYAGDRVGMPWCTPHVWRHTFISDLCDRNVNLAKVKELAGHKRIETTMGYVHFTAASFEAEVGVLNARNALLDKIQGQKSA